MYLQKKLFARKQCYEVVIQAALEEWQREPVELKCPACDSKKLSTRRLLKGKYTRFCLLCKHCFDQPDNFVCDCPEPGSQSKCHNCPNFRKLLATVKAMAEALPSRSLDQIQPNE